MTEQDPSTYRRCGKGHLIAGRNAATGTGRPRCRQCKFISDNRHLARRRGYPLCPSGHGLAPGAVTPEGGCLVCENPPPAPAETWLDWVAVEQAIMGRPLIRPLTRYEVVCMIATVARRGEIPRSTAADWIRANTAVTPPEDGGQYDTLVWAPKQGLPVVTVNGAIGIPLEPDLEIADYYGELDEDGIPIDDDELFRRAELQREAA